MSAIVIVDTSVFLNILDVPGRNQNRQEVLGIFKEMIEAGDHLLLPMAAIIETGRHIAHLENGQQRRQYAQEFVDQVKQALEGTAPWRPTNFPKKEGLLGWLDEFPDHAMRRLTFADLSIVKEWERSRDLHPMSRVWIWALDGHLSGYDRQP